MIVEDRGQVDRAVSRVLHMLMRSCNGGIPSTTTEVKVNLHNCKYIVCKYVLMYVGR